MAPPGAMAADRRRPMGFTAPGIAGMRWPGASISTSREQRHEPIAGQTPEVDRPDRQTGAVSIRCMRARIASCRGRTASTFVGAEVAIVVIRRASVEPPPTPAACLAAEAAEFHLGSTARNSGSRRGDAEPFRHAREQQDPPQHLVEQHARAARDARCGR